MMRVSRSVSVLLLAGCGLAMGALLGGCAAPSTAPGASSATEWQTASDETDARRRARTRLALASGYYENRQYTVALDEFKKTLRDDPTFADAYNLGGMIYLALGDQGLAEAHFQRALALDANDATAMHNLGWLKCQQGQYSEAQALFQRAIAVPQYTDRAKTIMTQGICEARAGQDAQAEATLMRAYELDAGNPVTGYNLALLLYRRGDYPRAQFYVRRLNISDLANAESLWLGIRIERRLNHREAMEQLASQLRRRFPHSRELLAYERGQFDD